MSARLSPRTLKLSTGWQRDIERGLVLMAFGTQFRYAIGRRIDILSNAVLSCSWFPLNRYVPRGHFCWYDIQRFASTRNLSVIFDVGANVGQTTHGLFRYFRNAEIYCFEPSSVPYKKLQAAYGWRRNVHCIPNALGAAFETRTLLTGADSELNTFVINGPRLNAAGGDEAVQVNTVDGFCEEQNIAAIDILKMDVQGWECEVLRGADRMISANRVRCVLSEVGFSKADTDMTQFSEVHSALEEKGYRFCGLYDNFRWGASKQYVGFANALYLNPEFSNVVTTLRS
jgi:FkbM family methyltransferase